MDRIVLDSPVGRMALECEGEALTALYLPHRLAEPVGAETPLLSRGRAELEEYFQGKRRVFDLPLAPKGTPFQQRVWQELAKVPWGTVVTYGELAVRVGSPKACRAVARQSQQSPAHFPPLPPGGGGKRQPHRLRRWAGCEAMAVTIGGCVMKKLLSAADAYIAEMNWKDLALVKLCLCAMGMLLGLAAPKKARKWVALGADWSFWPPMCP